VFCSTATFWVTTLFLRAFTQNREKNLWDIFLGTVSQGQLFIFSVGFLGPIVLAAGREPERAKSFPGRVSHLLVLIFLTAFAAGFYALHLTGGQTAASAVPLVDAEFLFRASICIALLSIVLRYLTMVYRASTLDVDVDQQLKQPVEDFAQQFADRHREEP
jgi:hypothetical protein